MSGLHQWHNQDDSDKINDNSVILLRQRLQIPSNRKRNKYKMKKRENI